MINTQPQNPGEYKPLRFAMPVNSIYARDARVRRYAEGLAKDGHFIDIICLADETGAEQSANPHIRVFPLPMTRNRREHAGLVFEWALAALLMFYKLTILQLKNRYDVVHVHNSPDFLVFAALLPRIMGAVVIFDVHDPTPELTRSKLGKGPQSAIVWMQVFIERLCFHFSSFVITAAPTFKDLLASRGLSGAKMAVVMNAADGNLFKAENSFRIAKTNNNRDFTLLYVGTVAKRYGLETVIRALPLIKKEIPNVKLRIYTRLKNEGIALRNSTQLASNLHISDSVELNEPAPLEQMPDIMKSSDLGVYPAYKDCHMDIALSLKIPEMANVGLPIIASRLTVLDELYGPQAIAFVPPGDVAAFAAKTIELYKNPKLRHNLATNAMERSKTFSWGSQYEIYIQVLERLVSRSLREPQKEGQSSLRA